MFTDVVLLEIEVPYTNSFCAFSETLYLICVFRDRVMNKGTVENSVHCQQGFSFKDYSYVHACMCMQRVFLEIVSRNWSLKRGTGWGGEGRCSFFMHTLCTIFEGFF